jgi:hypothetical protein
MGRHNMSNFFTLLWGIITFVQEILAYGTAYRLTKHGGDNGVALWGWLFVLNFASVIPGLGIYLWYKYRDEYDV